MGDYADMAYEDSYADHLWSIENDDEYDSSSPNIPSPYAGMFGRDIIGFTYLEILAETPKAWNIRFNYSKIPTDKWFPKSRAKLISDNRIEVDSWLLGQKIKEIKKERGID